MLAAFGARQGTCPSGRQPVESGLAIAGAQASAYGMFLGSIPYCFYNIFALILLLLTILLQREYGPMLRAERRARSGQPVRPASSP